MPPNIHPQGLTGRHIRTSKPLGETPNVRAASINVIIRLFPPQHEREKDQNAADNQT